MSEPRSTVSRRFVRSPGAPLTLLLAGLLFAACGKPGAFGEANSLIVVAESDSLWQQVQDTTYAALEPRFFSVREEKKFFVEPVDTTSTDDFQQLRIFRQVLIFGTPDNRFVQQVADEADLEGAPEPGQIFGARDVWAKNQVVTAIVLDPDDRAGSWQAALPELIERTDRVYRQFVRDRMFTSGPDTVARDSLAERFGFHIEFPQVYDVQVASENGPVVLRNDNPSPADLIRSVTVDSRAPMDSLTAEAAYEWRASVDSVLYNVPQAIDTTYSESRRFTQGERPALEVTGTWSDEGGSVPAAGPFVVWLVDCPERTHFLDGWVYAPGENKYQYVLQIREIMGSFRCSP